MDYRCGVFKKRRCQKHASPNNVRTLITQCRCEVLMHESIAVSAITRTYRRQAGLILFFVCQSALTCVISTCSGAQYSAEPPGNLLPKSPNPFPPLHLVSLQARPSHAESPCRPMPPQAAPGPHAAPGAWQAEWCGAYLFAGDAFAHLSRDQFPR